MNILLLEDDIDLNFIYKRQLEKSGYQTDAYSLGKDAVEAISQKDYDIALIDIMLPDTNGIEVIKKILVMPNKERMTIIVLSNMGDESVVDEAKKVGADEYLIKSSMNPEQLIERIIRVHTEKNAKVPLPAPK